MTEMVEVKVNGGYVIKLPRARAERPEWFTPAGWEKERIDALVAQVNLVADAYQRAPVVYYVGAEEGDIAAIVSTGGRELISSDMYLFEPNPKAWPFIKAIWDANELLPPKLCWPGFASGRIDPAADILLGRMSGDDPWPADVLWPPVEAHGFKELYLEADGYPNITLDYVAEKMESPDIIAFDVEGSEWEVMKGAEAILRSDHKPVIFASIHPEFMFHQWNQYSRDFRNWLISFGYAEQILAYEHELHTVYRPVK